MKAVYCNLCVRDRVNCYSMQDEVAKSYKYIQ
jgi:hypothetical protein